MSNQGFVKSLNLDASELSNSFQLWNNLYDEGSVAEDIQLFQPEQELLWLSTQDLIVDNKFVFTTQINVYKDGSRVQVFGSWTNSQLIPGEIYVVENSGQDGEGRSQFGLQGVTLSNMSVVQFTRQITQSELLNLVEPINENQEPQPGVYDAITNVRASLDTLSEDLGRLTQSLEEKLFPTQSTNLAAPLFVEGAVIIQDPAAYNTTVEKLTDAIGPGVFVSDPNSSQDAIQTLRKDSNAGEIWTSLEDPATLRTIAASANMDQLNISHTHLQVDDLIWDTSAVKQCVDTGTQFAAHINRSGELWTQGVNLYGQLGRTSTQTLGRVFTGVEPEPVWSQVSLGDHHVLALTVSGHVWAWGRNDSGQLGINSSAEFVATPTLLVGLTGVTHIRAGANSSACLVGTDLYVWGNNTPFGQLGLGDTVNRLVPTRIENAGVAIPHTHVSVGNHTLAIRANGTLWAAGQNTSGQLGIGNTTSPQTTFVQVGTDNTWTQVSVGSTHSLALKTNGSMWAWGANNRGQLGVGDTVNRLVPTATGTTVAGSPQTWIQISAGTEYSLVINKNYALYASGLNTNGELGNNSTSTRSSWAQLGLVTTSNGLGRKTWAQVVAGAQLSMGINHKGELLCWGLTAPFTQVADKQTQPVILASSTILLTQEATNTATIQVQNADQVLVDSLVKSVLVPEGIRVQSVNMLLNQITLTQPVNLRNNTSLNLVYDRWDSDQPVLFDKKTPVIVNDQTYYLLLRD